MVSLFKDLYLYYVVNITNKVYTWVRQSVWKKTSIFFIILGFIISFYFSWKLSCVTALVVPFIFVAIFLDSFSFGKQKNMESKVAENSNKVLYIV